MSTGISIHPSILSADFANLGFSLEQVSQADAIHVDVMDGHFVPNLTLGVPVVRRLLEVSSLPLDVHLMVSDPDFWALEYADLGVASITFHVEAAKAPIRLAEELRSRGVGVGLALSPSTSLYSCVDFLGYLDMLLVMSVEPGFGGQKFLDFTLAKIAAVRSILDESDLDVALQVDGGVTLENIGRIAAAGANVFVAGSSIYGHSDPNFVVEKMRVLGLSGR